MSEAHPDPEPSFASLQALNMFSDGPEPKYTLGPGDSITITVWGHPELSGQHVVGPDGRIQIALLGSVIVAGLTADQAGDALTRSLSEDYVAPVTTVQINSYTNNQVTVLGDVGNPGVIHFDDQPTLLDALAKAGASKSAGSQAPASKCAIFRGSDRVMWIDLRPLLRGNALAFNVRLRRNDVIYVPYAADELIYVLGQVVKPGAYPVTPNMSFVQALAEAGGPNDNAKQGEIVLARPGQNIQKVINLNNLVKVGGKANYSLQAGDIIFVPKSGIAKFGYVLQQLNPLTQTVFLGAALF